MTTVHNTFGREIDFETAVNLMDDVTRESVHNTLNNDVSNQEFFDLYCAAHCEKFKETFELNKQNPVY